MPQTVSSFHPPTDQSRYVQPSLHTTQLDLNLHHDHHYDERSGSPIANNQEPDDDDEYCDANRTILPYSAQSFSQYPSESQLPFLPMPPPSDSLPVRGAHTYSPPLGDQIFDRGLLFDGMMDEPNSTVQPTSLPTGSSLAPSLPFPLPSTRQSPLAGTSEQGFWTQHMPPPSTSQQTVEMQPLSLHQSMAASSQVDGSEVQRRLSTPTHIVSRGRVNYG